MKKLESLSPRELELNKLTKAELEKEYPQLDRKLTKLKFIREAIKFEDKETEVFLPDDAFEELVDDEGHRPNGTVDDLIDALPNDEELAEELGVQEIESNPDLEQAKYLTDKEEEKKALLAQAKAAEQLKIESTEGTTPWVLLSESLNDLIQYHTYTRAMQVKVNQVLVVVVCVSLGRQISVTSQLVDGKLIKDIDKTYKIV